MSAPTVVTTTPPTQTSGVAASNARSAAGGTKIRNASKIGSKVMPVLWTLVIIGLIIFGGYRISGIINHTSTGQDDKPPELTSVQSNRGVIPEDATAHPLRFRTGSETLKVAITNGDCYFFPSEITLVGSDNNGEETTYSFISSTHSVMKTKMLSWPEPDTGCPRGSM